MIETTMDLSKYALVGAGIGVGIILIPTTLNVMISTLINRRRTKKLNHLEEVEAKKVEQVKETSKIEGFSREREEVSVEESLRIAEEARIEEPLSVREVVDVKEPSRIKETAKVGQPLNLKVTRTERQMSKLKEAQSQTEPILQKPSPPSVAKPPVKPIAKPLEKPLVKSVTKPLEKPLVKPVTKPLEKPSITPAKRHTQISKPSEPNKALSREELETLYKNNHERNLNRQAKRRITHISFEAITRMKPVGPVVPITRALVNPIYIGRSKEVNDWVIEHDPAVSGRHCKIYQKEGSVYIEDLDSTNGILLNGRRIFKESKVADRDRVKIGQITYYITLL